jgi:hypothetical protein
VGGIILSDGIWGLIGVGLGTVLSIVSQYFFELRREKSKKRKYFIQKNTQIIENINSLENVVKQLLNIGHYDLSKYGEEELYSELNQTINHFSEKCSTNWSDFKIILLEYFPKTINNKYFMQLENTIIDMIFLYDNSKIIEPGQFKNKLESLNTNHEKYETAKNIIDIMKNEYYELIKKIRRNGI